MSIKKAKKDRFLTVRDGGCEFFRVGVVTVRHDVSKLVIVLCRRQNVKQQRWYVVRRSSFQTKWDNIRMHQLKIEVKARHRLLPRQAQNTT
jgi:hypothetical protein